MSSLLKVIFVFSFAILLNSCAWFGRNPPQQPSGTGVVKIIRDTVYLDPTGSLAVLPPNLKTQLGIKGIELPENILRKDYDSFTIKTDEPFYLDCTIDTNKSVIITKVETEKGEITFSVEPKFKPYEVLLNSICDAIYIPTTDLLIRIDDNYNKTNKPYKIVTVPICDNSKNITGYLVRYDTEGRVGKRCDNNKYVNDMEKMFKECQGVNEPQKPTCPCRVKSDCNAPEWKYFRICVSDRK